MRRIGLAVALAILLGGGAARADALDFTIFKEDDPIGHDIYQIDHAGDQTVVKVTTQTDVKVLFLEYHYHHDRTEVWKGGQVQSLVSDTNDDGTKHHFDMHRDGDALVATADGAAKSIPGADVPFTLWTDAFLKAPAMLDVTDFAEMKVKVEDKGADSIKIGANTISAHHYKTSGDLNWEFWYAADGALLKTAFKRRGYPISMVRQ